jgi:hypothetical protein
MSSKNKASDISWSIFNYQDDARSNKHQIHKNQTGKNHARAAKIKQVTSVGLSLFNYQYDARSNKHKIYCDMFDIMKYI